MDLFFICWITLHQLKFFRSANAKKKKKKKGRSLPKLSAISKLLFSQRFLMMSKTNYFPVVSGNKIPPPPFFLKSRLFRSAGNVIQRIKKVAPHLLRPIFVETFGGRSKQVLL